MWRLEAALVCWLCLAAALPQTRTLAGSQSRYGQECHVDRVDDLCGTNGRCKQESNKTVARCTCQQGYEYVNSECTKILVSTTEAPTFTKDIATPDSSSNTADGGNPVAAFLLVPTCFIIIGALVYFGARRYKWVQRFRQFRQNRYGSVLVTRDDTDDDDPPIA